MKQAIIIAVLLICSILTFAQIGSKNHSESNFTVNMFGELVSNVQPNMPVGFDAYGKSNSLKLDSINGDQQILISMEYFNYNPNGSIKSIVNKVTTHVNPWLQKNYYYNYFGLIDREVSKFKLYDTSAYEVKGVNYEYNQSSLLTSRVNGVYDNSNIFDTSFLENYTYNDHGDLILTEYVSRNEATSALELQAKTEYFYTLGNLDSACMYTLDNNFSSVVYIETYFRNAQSQVYLKRMEEIDGFLNEYNYDYYPIGLLNSIIETNYDSVFNAYNKPHSKIAYTYDLNGNLETRSRLRNPNLNDTSQTINWELRVVDTLKVDLNINISELIYIPKFYNDSERAFVFVHLPSEYNNYSIVNNILQPHILRTYFYSSFNLGVDTQIQEEVEVDISPNPFKESFMVKSDNLDKAERINIYNIVGELIKSEMISSNKEVISLPNIASGVYFIRILSDKRTILATKKIIKL